MTANSGQSTPRQRKFGRARNASSSPARLRRSWITAACATVNESIAPNEYIVLRNVVLPGSRMMIDTKPANTTSESHGVLNLGCSLRNALGSWR